MAKVLMIAVDASSNGQSRLKVECDEGASRHRSMGNEALTTEYENPYRSGGWVVVKDDLIHRLFPEGEFKRSVLEKRVAFIVDEAWDAIGLPR